MNRNIVYTKAAGFLIGVILLWPPANISAQNKGHYTLVELIDSAQHHLPVLLQKKALLNSAQAGIANAKHAFLPNAFIADELTLGSDNSLPGSYMSYGIIPSTSNGIRTSNDYQSAAGNIAILQGDYELLDFGFKKASIKNAEAFADLSQADLEREIYSLKWQTGKLYFEFLKNLFQSEIDHQNVNRAEAIYNVILAVTRSGIKAGADSSLALAEFSKSRISYNQVQGQIRQLQQELSYVTGIPVDQISVDSTKIKSYLSAMDIQASGNYPDTIHNPLIAYFERQKQLSLKTEQVIKKSYLPRVLVTGSAWARGSSLDASGKFKSPTNGLGFQRFNYIAGATLLYDLFNTAHRRDQLAIRHFQTLASDYELMQQVLSLKNVGNQAEEAILTAGKNLQEIPIQIKASLDGYDQKTAQYKAGIINLIDLTNASFVLYRSQSDYVQTLSDWLLANLDKAATSGNLDLFIQSIKN